MEFYVLHGEDRISIVGAIPQLNYMVRKEGEFATDSPSKRFPEIRYKWVKGAKVTDIIQANGPGISYILNERTIEALEHLHLPPHQFLPVTHVEGADLKEYYYFHCYEKHDKYVDFGKSIFSIFQFNDLLEERKFSSHEEIQQYEEENKNIRLLRVVPKELYLLEDIHKRYDYFSPAVGFGHAYKEIVTETFKTTIEDNNLKGMSFKPCPYLRV